MINVKITLDTTCNNLAVSLHPPGPAKPYPLPGAKHGIELALDPGVYYVQLGGTGEAPGTVAKVTFASSTGSKKTRQRIVKPNGTIEGFISFKLDASGGVS